ncbi:MAG: iduronate-2-sulfatase, partial [Pirellulaceae bacterium]|nr:iduronate-2-sulfatase [Pirellulaceae bacterium]
VQIRDETAQSQYSRFGDRFIGEAVRTDRYRFVQWRDVKLDHVVEQELYDHQTDPNETENVAATRPDVVERLQALVK